MVDIYRAAKGRGKLGCHFFPSCSEVNSAGYSEFDEPISMHV